VLLVVGESLTDRVIALDGTSSDHAGGGPFNSARTIGRLGRDVALVTVIGADERGAECVRLLAESGVDTSYVRQIDLPTTLALATLDESGAATYVFDFETSAARHLERLELPVGTTFLHVGTLALVLEPFATAVETAIAALPDEVSLLVDPNCRPTVVRDAAAFIGHVRADLARADVVKLSDDDFAYLRSLDATFPTPEELIENGTSCVLFSRGSTGVEVYGPWGRELVAAPHVVVADTVGAGDSLSGAFVAWCDEAGLRRHDLRNREVVVAAARYAVRVAAITVSRAGANPPTTADLEAFDFRY
jgi:fructokinase